MPVDITSQITTAAIKFLSQMGFDQTVTVQTNFDSKNNLYQVLLQTDKPSLLIGYHGENLSAMQLVFGQHLHSLTGQWLNLSLNVNDYRERRQFTLHSLADSAITQVIATGQPHSLPPMPSSERRIIHLYLADHPKISTFSQGVGKNRCLVISPKN